MRRTFDSANIGEKKQQEVAVEMLHYTTILSPLFTLHCPDGHPLTIDDSNVEIPWENKPLEHLHDNWKDVAEGWADNYGLPPIGTIVRKGASGFSTSFKITARGFDIPSQPASDELYEIKCLSCDDEHDLRELEYRHIPMGETEKREFQHLLGEYHGISVWELNQKLD